MNTDWLNNPKLQNIDEKKLNLLVSLAKQAEQKNPDELLPFFLAVTKKANALGISFNDDETEIILSVLKSKMSTEDIKKMEMIKNLGSLISSKQKKNQH